MKAWISSEPWRDGHDVRLGANHGSSTVAHATGVKDGRIVWEVVPEGTTVEPFLYLSRNEYEALARAFGEQTHASDATVDALKDVRTVRDRLLSMLEKHYK